MYFKELVENGIQQMEALHETFTLSYQWLTHINDFVYPRYLLPLLLLSALYGTDSSAS